LSRPHTEDSPAHCFGSFATLAQEAGLSAMLSLWAVVASGQWPCGMRHSTQAGVLATPNRLVVCERLPNDMRR
jgi:hypothetical protein